ncbi:DUF1553 domain-containing protein [Rubripirellula reticaptiva]|uniref:Planctomycete cytochrome C n=1 Tax=Rubripirellula reticaptiva TaxID=2528013 RepID=A0A5C6F1A7_9BACT|nr:DUF1553 domain-containing protein [Rubripirellula reticaptiva]TWU55613.1 Planctomycete cytochrome C [Rubripirellula reticaptiva]
MTVNHGQNFAYALPIAEKVKPMKFSQNGVRYLATCVCLTMTIAANGLAEDLQFNRDIRPLFSDTCFKCHGPDAKTREAGLRLDQLEAAVEDLGGYAAIVPGHPDDSEALKRIESDDPDLMMPPPESGLILSDSDKQTLRQWIAEGAVYQSHWAFEPIQRPDPPAEFAQHTPLDAFVLDRLKQANLDPLGPAQPTTLLRRVSLDLTGFPPTIQQSQRFVLEVETQGLDDAYRRAVDRLLQSPRFGEHMTWLWIEAARYADTDGYQNDGPREMWRWRDWVIDAYNSNLSFDQFTIKQLAGDLLPNPSEQDLIATAFNRNNRYNSEEGIPIDEFLLENAVDRVDTTATVWMAATVGCARCHDHKYDPFSQREYYQLIDFFNDVDESGRAIKYGNSEPWIKTPTDDDQKRLSELQHNVARCAKRLLDAESEIALAQQSWQTPAELDTAVSIVSNGLDHFFGFDGPDARVSEKQGKSKVVTIKQAIKPVADPADLSAPKVLASQVGAPDQASGVATLSGDNHYDIGKIPGLIGNGRFSIAFWFSPDQVDSGAVLSNEQSTTQRSGNLVEFVDGHLQWSIIHRWISGVSAIQTTRTFEPGQWTHMTLTNDGTQRARGMEIYVDGVPQPVEVIRNTNSNTAKRDYGAAMNIGYSKTAGTWKGKVDQLRFYTSRTLSQAEAELLAVAESVKTIGRMPNVDRSESQTRKMRAAYLQNTKVDQHRRLLFEMRKAESALTEFSDSLPTTMIMQDLPEGRPSFVRTRGVYDQLGEAAPAGVPAVFPPLQQPADRLAFAKWLVDGKHPLTARVMVNRYWQMLFGRGLVNTPEDFGSQGELPSHPELLDWLASEFVDSGWDVKALLKTIVTSDTYRRSSKVGEQHLQYDPGNVFYARSSRKRLSGNVLRDQALQVSGLLVEKVGGPSVYPYQPDGLWSEASNFKYTPGKGSDLYRRSLYTYWKRTLSPPNMALLDTADREWCSIKLRQTNTPLQALTLMNDVTFAEAARKFGELVLESAGNDRDRIKFAFHSLLCRAPTDAEQGVLLAAWESYRREFLASPDLADKVVSIGQSESRDAFDQVERAAATALANVLLNLEEATTRD